jgi:serine/threonine protein kinase
VDENYKVKVSDFGLAKLVDSSSVSQMTSCGTPAWTAPEVLRNEKYDEKCDVYSFGIVLWELVTREDPHHGMPPFQVVFAVGTQGIRPTIPSSCPPEFAHLIEDCWDENPRERVSKLFMVSLILLAIF